MEVEYDIIFIKKTFFSIFNFQFTSTFNFTRLFKKLKYFLVNYIRAIKRRRQDKTKQRDKTMTDLIRIPKIENYTQEIINGDLILTPKKQYLTENELYMTQITNSSIVECLIQKEEEKISTEKSYRGALIDIWKSMPTQKILQTTSFNFKLTNENGKKGYYWCDEIKMSFQSKDDEQTLKEIIRMVKENKLTIKLIIKLEIGRMVHFKI